ncbi:MAG: SRPBCC family protein [Bacteroidetes bacterium]|nr:SRPBCC family protein [Bacteroidota bacterium]
MKIFKRIIIWLVALITVLVIIAFLLPKTYKVERSIYIKANNQTISNLVVNLTKWDLWSPWTTSVDTTMKYELVGKDGQVGTKRTWTGKKMGSGEMVISELLPGQKVALDLNFNNGKIKSKSEFTFESQGDTSKVSWMITGDLGYNPMARYMGLFMNKMMGPDFEKGLAKLKKVAEQRANWPKIEEVKIDETMALIVMDSAGPKNYSQVFAKGYMEIGMLMKANGLRQVGPAFARYLKYDTVSMLSVMDFGFPVDKTIEKGKGRVRFEKFPAQQVMMAYYHGPYDKTGPTYWALEQSIKESGKQISGAPVELYVTDPMMEKDTAKWETDIFFPIK